MGSDLIFRRNGSIHHLTNVHDQFTPGSSHKSHLPLPIRYLLAKQRLLCLLAGVSLSALFFTVSTPVHRPPIASQFNTGLRNPVAGSGSAFGHGYVGRVPLGLKEKKGKRILVTGGAGFVGSHLVDRLMERGDSVIVLDNYFTGRKENVIHHLGNPRFELIRHDVVEPILLEVDQIYHLACPASPVHYKFNPIKTIISFVFLLSCISFLSSILSFLI